MLVMSRTVGILTHAWTRVLTTLSIAVTAAILAACSMQLGGGPPVAEHLARRLPPTPQSAKAKCVSL
jgi:hypothetical protein